MHKCLSLPTTSHFRSPEGTREGSAGIGGAQHKPTRQPCPGAVSQKRRIYLQERLQGAGNPRPQLTMDTPSLPRLSPRGLTRLPTGSSVPERRINKRTGWKNHSYVGSESGRAWSSLVDFFRQAPWHLQTRDFVQSLVAFPLPRAAGGLRPKRVLRRVKKEQTSSHRGR